MGIIVWSYCYLSEQFNTRSAEMSRPPSNILW